MNIWQKILNSVLPPRCILCGKILNEEEGLCPECFNGINFISRPYCARCGRPFAEAPSDGKLLCPSCLKSDGMPFRMCRSAFHYDDASKNLILGLKFMDKTENAGVLARFLFQAGRDIWAAGADLLLPVPLHYTRLIKRRYNQSALLAGELEKLVLVPVDYNSVVRHKKTRPQVEFSGHERVKNVKGAFLVRHPEQIRGKKIVLIDDVMTTGSTLKECALVLQKAGASSVDALTVARVC